MELVLETLELNSIFVWFHILKTIRCMTVYSQEILKLNLTVVNIEIEVL
jgi:hypothetical protein